MDIDASFAGDGCIDAVFCAECGKILMVSHSGWYIETDKGALMLLLPAHYGYLPFGIGIESFYRLEYNKRLEGRDVHFASGRIFLPDGTAIKLPKAAGKLPRSKAEASASMLREVLLEKGRGGLKKLLVGTEDSCTELYCIYAKEYIQALMSALRCQDMCSAENNVRALLGLGPGLTPSGDDFLVGFMYALTAVGKDGILKTVSAAVKKHAGERTNKISCAYLFAAAKGEYLAILEGCLMGSRSCAELLTAVGGSSGSDMLTGIISALEI